MRIIDAVLHPDRLDELCSAADGCGHRTIILSRTDDTVILRIVVSNGDPDEFLDDFRKHLRENEPGPNHYTVFEPLAVEPPPDDDEDEEDSEAGSEEIEQFVSDGRHLTRTFLILSGLSGILAAGGLILDNVAVVVGAMVLAPLFKPIALVGVATLLGKPKRMLLGLAWVLTSLGLSAVVGGLVALATPGAAVTQQITARTGISAFDLVIALSAGIAMALTLLKRDITAMVGIVVAASIVPVAAALGVVTALGEWALAAGALYTLVSNLCGITLGLIVGLRFAQLRGLTNADQRKGEQWGRRSIIAGSALALVLLGLALWSYRAGRLDGTIPHEELAKAPGVLAVWAAAGGQPVLLVDPETFTPPDNLSKAAIILPAPSETTRSP